MGNRGFRVESIELADGWSGRVLVGCDVLRESRPLGVATTLPNRDQWIPVLEKLVADRENLPDYTLLKYSAGGEVFRARLPFGERSVEIIAKQNRMRSLGRRVSAFLVGSRETRNFDRARTLLDLGIDTALPLVELRRRRGTGEAWLIAEYVPDLVDLDQVALGLLPKLSPEVRGRTKRMLIEAVVDLLDTLERSRLTHRDLKASNVLLRDWDGRTHAPSIVLVDLDGLRRPLVLSAGRRRKHLVRLAASLLDHSNVTRADFARLLRSYLSRRGAAPGDWRILLPQLLRQAAAYARRSRNRKADKLDGYTASAS